MGRYKNIRKRAAGDTYCLECGKRIGSYTRIEIQTRRGSTIYVCESCISKRMKKNEGE